VELRGRALRLKLVETLLDVLLQLKTKAHINLFAQSVTPAPFLLALIQQPSQVQKRFVISSLWLIFISSRLTLSFFILSVLQTCE
jgi:hypothetical protein